MAEKSRKRKAKNIFDFFSKVFKGSDENNNTVSVKDGTDSVTGESPTISIHDECSNSKEQSLPDESVSTVNTDDKTKSQNDINTVCKPKQKDRCFQRKWLTDFTWLDFNKDTNTMTCKLCLKHSKSNAMTNGKCQNWKTSTLTRHADSSDHKESVVADQLSGTVVKKITNMWTEKEASVVCAMKAAFWIAKEDLAISKYESLVNLLMDMKCPDIDKLKCRENVSYTSDKAAEEFINSIAHIVREKVSHKISKSPYISLLCDETTDVAVSKKLSIYCRIVDPETLCASTHYVCNVEVDSGTGKAIFTELKKVMKEKNIPPEKVMGLGTDGAKAMTGMKEGLTGYMSRDNPMIVNYHCVAHRLALVTSQAADEIAYLVDYQSVLTGIFYYFKASAVRCHNLVEVQTLLDEPTLRVKEVHQVRWMSVYIAVETIYKILDSLITYFTQDKDAKGKGYQKKMIQYDFIATTYLLMDVLPVVSELCLVFQKSDIDVSLVKVHVDNCKRALNDIKEGKAHFYLDKFFNEDLSMDKGKCIFKSNHVVQGKKNIDSIKQKLIDGILKKIDERFPDDKTNLMYAFGALSMRPISFLSAKERETWGNDKIETLVQHFGEAKTSSARNDQPEQTIAAIIDPVQTKREWNTVKDLVVKEGYPRDKMSQLWFLLQKYYNSEFPNLLKLVCIALTAPVHTADCERGFSAQNLIKTGQRNRLSPETVDNLLTIKLEGGASSDFDYKAALFHWKNLKERRIFSSSSRK